MREEHPGIAQGLSVSLLAWLSFSMLPTRGCLGFSEVEGLLILVSVAYGLAVVQGVWRFSRIAFRWPASPIRSYQALELWYGSGRGRLQLPSQIPGTLSFLHAESPPV